MIQFGTFYFYICDIKFLAVLFALIRQERDKEPSLLPKSYTLFQYVPVKLFLRKKVPSKCSFTN